jgi:predicted amidophosphoribosyltransferase
LADEAYIDYMKTWSKRYLGRVRATFTPTERQREYRTPVQTCPECIAQGRRARGDRGDKQPTVCVVCGEVFPRTQKNQLRCPACKAAKPKWAPRRHARYYELHGYR